MLLCLDWCRDHKADVAAFQEKGGDMLGYNSGRLSDIFERNKVPGAKHPELLHFDDAHRLSTGIMSLDWCRASQADVAAFQETGGETCLACTGRLTGMCLSAVALGNQ